MSRCQVDHKQIKINAMQSLPPFQQEFSQLNNNYINTVSICGYIIMSSEPAAPSQKPTKLAQFLNTFRNTVYTDLFGPKIMPMRYVINIFKGLTFIWIIALMFYFNNYSNGMKLYLFLHGTYGIFWLLKDLLYPDSSFKQMASVGSLVILTTALVLYWMMPVTIAVGLGVQQPTKMRTIFCIATYLIGVFLMLGADIQKTATLAKRKGLISTGFFSRTRNPNYLGQIMIYGSFAACTGYWVSYAIVMTMWFTLFAINMYLKDEYSYKLKQGWDQYKKKSYILLPKLFKSNFINFAIYVGLSLILYNYYQQCCDGHGHDHHDHGHGHHHEHQHHV